MAAWTSLVAMGVVSSGQTRDEFGMLSQLEKCKIRKYKNTSNLFIQNENSYYQWFVALVFSIYFICHFITDYIFHLNKFYSKT